MRTGIRVSLVDDNDFIHRISYARLNRLVDGKRGEVLPQFGGKRMRCAMVWLDVTGNKPLRIRKIDYFFLPLDGEGRINTIEWERQMHSAVDLLSAGVPTGPRTKNVIDARHRFAKRRHDHEYSWKPTRKIEQTIIAQIFGEKAAD
jgi:hypothetical protein